MTHVDEEDLFEITLAKCRAGFEMRQPDAKATAEKLLVTYAAQASTLHLRADARWMKMAYEESDRLETRAGALEDRAIKLTLLLHEFKDANLNRSKSTPGPTPEAKVRGRSRKTSISRLNDAGKLSHVQAKAADEIAEIYETVTLAMFAKCRTLDGARVDIKGRAPDIDYKFMSEWIARAHRDWYIPWTQRAGAEIGDQATKLVFDVVVFGMTLDQSRRERHMAYATALDRLGAALTLYASISGLGRRLGSRSRGARRRGRRRGGDAVPATNS